MLSIIMPLKNNLEYTRKAVSSLLMHTREPLELIFIDDCSTDGTVDYLHELAANGLKSSSITPLPRRAMLPTMLPGPPGPPGPPKPPDLPEISLTIPSPVPSTVPLKILFNPGPLGVTKNWNKGLVIAQGEYVAIVNNDLLFTDSWDVTLIAALESGAWLAAPWFTTHELPDDFPLGKGRSCCDYIRDQHFLGACFVTRRDLYRRIGLFPAGLVYWFADTWLEQAIKAHGGEVREVKESYVHHYYSKSIKEVSDLTKLTDKDREHYRLLVRDRKFEKIEVMSTWYNEAFLAPFFLKHYDFADTIHLFIDADTNDETLGILHGNPKVVLHPFTFPDGLDDDIKVGNINTLFRDLDCSWVINVDADEFIFSLPLGTEIENKTALRSFLLTINDYNLIICQLRHVYRHISDLDLDPRREVIVQRRHGSADPVMPRQLMSYDKPILCRPGSHDGWKPGNHAVIANSGTKIAPEMVSGAHWAMADLFCLKRRIQERKLRQSEVNIKKTYGRHHDVSRKELLAEMESHLNDEKLF